MNRYAKIRGKFPREFLLLRGTGCFHKKCLFCDYYLDASENPFPENKAELDKITGEFGALDVINSGSAHELDLNTLEFLRKQADEKNISKLWFEAHYSYHNSLSEIRAFFPRQTVKFRTGIESFNSAFRLKMEKGVPDVTPEHIRLHFEGVCLLVGVEGQTKAGILRDISIASRLFEYFSVNLFCPNTTAVKRDEALAAWFSRDIYPIANALPNCEIILNNTDLGVGVFDCNI